jgi:hypothetical protein
VRCTVKPLKTRTRKAQRSWHASAFRIFLAKPRYDVTPRQAESDLWLVIMLFWTAHQVGVTTAFTLGHIHEGDGGRRCGSLARVYPGSNWIDRRRRRWHAVGRNGACHGHWLMAKTCFHFRAFAGLLDLKTNRRADARAADTAVKPKCG